ncbi:MAG: hypothetical protein M3Y64_09300, partial [Gemmatimonadota bacterium]|nr:hypothetical protein [Gemmatimonadota bacterium]
ETLVSSERSDYSPVVTFRARVRTTDSVHVHVGRLRILSPGPVFEGMPAITGKLVMQALLVSASDGTVGTANGALRPWTERAASTPVALVDSLVMGRPQDVLDLNFVLPLPSGIADGNSWLVFRVTGASVSAPVQMADGGVIPAHVDADGIRVFACAEQNLNGKTDKKRARQLKTAYNASC